MKIRVSQEVLQEKKTNDVKNSQKKNGQISFYSKIWILMT